MDGTAHGVEQEGTARRLLGLNAGYLVAAGAVLAIAASAVAGQVRLPARVVRAIGMTAVAGGVGLGFASAAEDWVSVTRRTAGANIIASAGLSGLAASRGEVNGRLGALAVAVPLGGMAYGQVRALAARQGGVIA